MEIFLKRNTKLQSQKVHNNQQKNCQQTHNLEKAQRSEQNIQEEIIKTRNYIARWYDKNDESIRNKNT